MRPAQAAKRTRPSGDLDVLAGKRDPREREPLARAVMAPDIHLPEATQCHLAIFTAGASAAKSWAAHRFFSIIASTSRVVAG